MVRVAAPAVPNSVAFEVTRRCNLACAHCYNVWKVATPSPATAELDTDTLAAAITRTVAATGTRSVVLTGGEPLLRDDIRALLTTAATAAPSVTLVTNATRLDGEVAALLADLGRVRVQVTLLAGDRARHDELRGGPSFDATLEAVASLRERSVPVAVCFVCTQRNHAELQRVLDLVVALGVRVVGFNRLATVGDGATNRDELAPSIEQLEAALAVANARAAAHGLQVTTGVPIPPCLVAPEVYPHVKFTWCSSATSRSNFVVDASGFVRACVLSPTVLGNVLRDGWPRIMKASYLREFDRALPSVCRPCALARTCRGGCKEAARATGGLRHEEPLLAAARRCGAAAGT